MQAFNLLRQHWQAASAITALLLATAISIAGLAMPGARANATALWASAAHNGMCALPWHKETVGCATSLLPIQPVAELTLRVSEAMRSTLTSPNMPAAQKFGQMYLMFSDSKISVLTARSFPDQGLVARNMAEAAEAADAAQDLLVTLLTQAESAAHAFETKGEFVANQLASKSTPVAQLQSNLESYLDLCEEHLDALYDTVTESQGHFRLLDAKLQAAQLANNEAQRVVAAKLRKQQRLLGWLITNALTGDSFEWQKAETNELLSALHSACQSAHAEVNVMHLRLRHFKQQLKSLRGAVLWAAHDNAPRLSDQRAQLLAVVGGLRDNRRRIEAAAKAKMRASQHARHAAV